MKSLAETQSAYDGLISGRDDLKRMMVEEEQKLGPSPENKQMKRLKQLRTQYKKNQKEAPFLLLVVRYLQSSPSEELLKDQVAGLEREIKKSMNLVDYQAWKNFQPRNKESTLEKQWRELHRVKEKKSQLRMLKYILQ